MSKRAKIALAFFLTTIVGIFAWGLLRSSEPAYQGKSLHAWLRDLDFGDRTPRAAAARFAIQQMGTNSVPTLIYYLRHRDSPFKYEYAWIVNNVLRRGGVSFERDWHRRALLALQILGPAAESAIPALVDAANDPSIAGQVTVALAGMLPVSAPVVTNLLANGKPMVRLSAAVALSGCLSNPETELSAVIALTNALSDPDPQLRQAAAHALGHSSSHARLVVPALLKALDETNAGVQIAAVNSLGNLGTNAQSGMPAILRLWHENAGSADSVPTQLPWDLRSFATAAMKRIDPASAILDLLAAASDNSSQIRANAILDLGTLAMGDEHSSPVVAALLRASKDPNDSVRKAAFFGLARFAPVAKEIYPTLNRELETRSPELDNIISGLITTLSGSQGDAMEAVPFLIQGLSDSNEYIRTASANALKQIDPDAASQAGVK